MHPLAAISLKLMKPPMQRTVDYAAYDQWRHESLTASWSAFDDQWITDRDVLDFGCGDGQMSAFLIGKNPKTMTGVDLNAEAIERAKRPGIDFLVGAEDAIPCPDQSFDTILAFDCMEHVMQPREILDEWFRVLRPDGRVLIEWFPFKGPWGPHMESLIPVPWAHVLFSEQTLFKAAAEIYDHPSFQPRHWDMENGQKRPNKWRQWSTFKEQGYVNELDIKTFKRLATEAGFDIDRLYRRGFSGPAWRQSLGTFLMLFGEHFVMSAIIELVKPCRPHSSRH